LDAITIRPDAKTGNRSWPCRELSCQRTPIQPHRGSRFGDAASCQHGTLLRRHSAVIAPRVIDFRYFVYCGCALHWQARWGWLHFA
jgi:hypothetical protein